MQEDFPQSASKFLKAAMFQDTAIPLTFKGWEKKGNEDSKDTKWRDKLKYQLRYSYPEFACDEYGAKRLGKDGQPFQNKYWDANFPQGYSIIYYFEEGELESGSLPLFEAFCMVRPKKGDVITIKRVGQAKETKWFVSKSNSAELPSRDVDEFGADNNVPF